MLSGRTRAFNATHEAAVAHDARDHEELRFAAHERADGSFDVSARYRVIAPNGTSIRWEPILRVARRATASVQRGRLGVVEGAPREARRVRSPRSTAPAPTRSRRARTGAPPSRACARSGRRSGSPRISRADLLAARSWVASFSVRGSGANPASVVDASPAHRRRAGSIFFSMPQRPAARHVAIAMYGLMSAAVCRYSRRVAAPPGDGADGAGAVLLAPRGGERRPNAGHVALVAVDRRRSRAP